MFKDEADAQKALGLRRQPDVSLVRDIKESVDAMERAVEATGTDVSDFNRAISRHRSDGCSVRSNLVPMWAVIGTDHAVKYHWFLYQVWRWRADISVLSTALISARQQLLQALGS